MYLFNKYNGQIKVKYTENCLKCCKRCWLVAFITLSPRKGMYIRRFDSSWYKQEIKFRQLNFSVLQKFQTRKYISNNNQSVWLSDEETKLRIATKEGLTLHYKVNDGQTQERCLSLKMAIVGSERIPSHSIVSIHNTSLLGTLVQCNVIQTYTRTIIQKHVRAMS